MRHRKRSFHIFDGQRLRVFAARTASGGIADMADRHGAAEPVERIRAEYLADQADVLVE